MCVDNSEFTRNGDYTPTRFQAQADAVNLLAGAKTQHHPENTVGVMTMAGKTPQVLVTPTADLGKVLGAMQQMKIEGDVHLSTAVQIAQLALKHRENKNQRQRVVIFIGSPIQETKVRHECFWIFAAACTAWANLDDTCLAAHDLLMYRKSW